MANCRRNFWKGSDIINSYDQAINQLKQVHKINQKNGWDYYRIGRDTYMAMNSSERAEMEKNFKFMLEEGWIKPYLNSVSHPVSYALTSLGTKIAEDIIDKPAIEQIHYHIGSANNSIIGNNPHNNTINVGTSFEELKLLIEQNFSDHNERKEILDVLNNLQNKINSAQPLEKGYLSKINDKLENCSWLSAGIAAQVLQYLTKPNP